MGVKPVAEPFARLEVIPVERDITRTEWPSQAPAMSVQLTAFVGGALGR